MCARCRDAGLPETPINRACRRVSRTKWYLNRSLYRTEPRCGCHKNTPVLSLAPQLPFGQHTDPRPLEPSVRWRGRRPNRAIERSGWPGRAEASADIPEIHGGELSLRRPLTTYKAKHKSTKNGLSRTHKAYRLLKGMSQAKASWPAPTQRRRVPLNSPTTNAVRAVRTFLCGKIASGKMRSYRAGR